MNGRAVAELATDESSDEWQTCWNKCIAPAQARIVIQPRILEMPLANSYTLYTNPSSIITSFPSLIFSNTSRACTLPNISSLLRPSLTSGISSSIGM